MHIRSDISGESGWRSPEALKTAKDLLRTIGTIALAYNVKLDDTFRGEVLASLSEAILATEEPDRLSVIVLGNLRMGFNSLTDETDSLGSLLEEFGDDMRLDTETAALFRNAMITELSRVLAMSGEAAIVPEQGDDVPVEPTEAELAKTEEEYERLAHVPINDDAQADYMRKYARHEILNAAEEVELARKIEIGVLAEERLTHNRDTLTGQERRELQTLVRDGARSKDKLFSSNLRLVINYARGYTRSGMNMLDLIQEGNIGLLHAIELFDFTLGYKFSTFATWHIRQSITRAINDKSTMVRLPVHVHEKINAIHASRHALERELVREVTDDEIAEDLDVSVAYIKRMREYEQSVLSINAPVGDDDREFGELIMDDAEEDPTVALSQEELSLQIASILRELDDSQMNIIRLRLGIGYDEPRTIDETAAIMNMPRIEVRKIESRVMNQLKRDGRVRLALESHREG